MPLNLSFAAAFALSSGTIGAALSSSLSKVRSVALSYGTVLHPTPATFFEPAHQLGSRIIQYLWNNWGKDKDGLRKGEIDLYNINIPLVEGLLSEEGLKVCSTTMWRNSYGRLFEVIEPEIVQSAGPDALDSEPEPQKLLFKFAPDMKGLINPSLSSLPVGSDGWAICQGWVSVTPLRASFGEPPEDGINIEHRLWKMKL